MTELEKHIENYLLKLENHLDNLPAVERNNQIQEVKDHLISFIEEYRAKGLSETEIVDEIQNGFLSTQEVAKKLLKGNKSHKLMNKYTIVIAAVVTMFISYLLPVYKTVPLSILLFAMAFYIYKKKVLWGFSFYRQNPGQIKNRSKIANVGAIYIFIVGLIILLVEFIAALQTETTFWVLIVGYVAYMGYVRKNTTG